MCLFAPFKKNKKVVRYGYAVQEINSTNNSVRGVYNYHPNSHNGWIRIGAKATIKENPTYRRGFYGYVKAKDAYWMKNNSARIKRNTEYNLKYVIVYCKFEEVLEVGCPKVVGNNEEYNQVAFRARSRTVLRILPDNYKPYYKKKGH